MAKRAKLRYIKDMQLPTVINRLLPRLFTGAGALWLLLLASVGSLATAYIAQYAFDYQPCVLCLWQRLPWWSALLLAAFGLLAGRFLRPARFYQALSLLLLALAFLAGAALAGYHIGVEQLWWAGTSGCSASHSSASSIEALRASIMAAPVVSCAEPSWFFMGLSMTSWNFIVSLPLAIYAALISWRVDHG